MQDFEKLSSLAHCKGEGHNYINHNIRRCLWFIRGSNYVCTLFKSIDNIF